MSRTAHPVFRALDRWVQEGLLDEDSAAPLRAEVEEEIRKESRRWAQFALAATGGAVLIIAGATFLAWAWPAMGYGGQSAALGVIGVAVGVLGMRLMGRPRLKPVAYLLQIVGPILFFMALAYSENAWADGTVGGVVAGALGLAAPVVLIGSALKKDPVLAAIHTAFSFLFLFLFLDRALSLGLETSLWVLDGLGMVGLAWLGYRLRAPEAPPWVLDSFVSILYASIVLLFLTGDLLWDLEEFVIIPLDLWLLTVAGISVWALQEGLPVHLRRDWYERQLAYCVLLAIPFGFITTFEVMKTGPDAAALTVGGIGALGLWFGISRDIRSVLLASCVALLSAAWFYGAEKAGALGAVLALTGTAVILFWGSSRLGRGKSQEAPVGVAPGGSGPGRKTPGRSVETKSVPGESTPGGGAQ